MTRATSTDPTPSRASDDPGDPSAGSTGTRQSPLVARTAPALLSLGAGALVALSLPPWGLWPLAIVGVALFEISLGRSPTRRQRWWRGWMFGVGWLAFGTGWMIQLTAPGYVVATIVFGAYHGLAALAAPTGRWRIVGRPATHALAEALRLSFPFGGVPLATLGISQVSGPLAEVARVGGVILMTWLVLQIGVAIGAALTPAVEGRLDPRRGAAHGPSETRGDAPLILGALLVSVVVVLTSFVAPTGESTGESIRVAVVQGGGEQGTRASDVESEVVTERHLAATRTITRGSEPDLDLVVWPENAIDVDDVAFSDSVVADQIRAEAARLGVPFSVGLTEDVIADGRRRYTNAQVIVTPDGEIVSRYDKVRRVPFGEYVPFRSTLERITSAVDQVGDAVAGTEPAVLDLPDGTRLATVISWEVFFGGRAREGVRLGADLVVNPTNGASYTGTIVQTQQVASSRLRAIETGRWVAQVSPTGFSAFVSPDGEVVQRSGQREQRVLVDDVELRTGRTWYVSIGDGPFIVALVVIALAAWALAIRSRRSASPVRR